MIGRRNPGNWKTLPLVLAGTASLAACEPPPPAGQVLAAIDGEDVTLPELEHEAAFHSLDLAEANEEQRAALLEHVVARRILAGQARGRGLEQDAEYHFALRRVREELLAEALLRDIRRDLPAPRREQVEALLARQPWRFANEFVLSLVAVGGNSPDDWMQLASRDYPAPPPAEISEARPGAILMLRGKAWRVEGRRQLANTPEGLRARAAAELAEGAARRELDHLVEAERNAGAVRYAVGYGPASR